MVREWVSTPAWQFADDGVAGLSTVPTSGGSPAVRADIVADRPRGVAGALGTSVAAVAAFECRAVAR